MEEVDRIVVQSLISIGWYFLCLFYLNKKLEYLLVVFTGSKHIRITFSYFYFYSELVTPEITSVSQFTPELFIEAVAKLLNIINPGNEPLPTKLPPNTGVKFRICTKFATICQV